MSKTREGRRDYSRELLETIPYHANSDDFVFDQELIAQVVATGMRDRIGEIGVPTRYFEEASSVGFERSVVYGLSTLRVVARYLLHRLHLRPSPKLRAPRRVVAPRRARSSGSQSASSLPICCCGPSTSGPPSRCFG